MRFVSVVIPEEYEGEHAARAWLAAGPAMAAGKAQLWHRPGEGPLSPDAEWVLAFNGPRAAEALREARVRGIPSVYVLGLGGVTENGPCDVNAWSPSFQTDRRFKAQFAEVVLCDSVAQIRAVQSAWGWLEFSPKLKAVEPAPLPGKPVPRSFLPAEQFCVLGGIGDWNLHDVLTQYGPTTMFREELDAVNFSVSPQRAGVGVIWLKPPAYAERFLYLCRAGVPLAAVDYGICQRLPAYADWLNLPLHAGQQADPRETIARAAQGLQQWTEQRSERQKQAVANLSWENWLQEVERLAFSAVPTRNRPGESSSGGNGTA